MRRWVRSRFLPLSLLDYAAVLAAALGLLDEVVRFLAG